MELVGQILKKNRESKNIKLSEVSKELKISEDLLRNIESGHLQTDIDKIFIIGHLRSFCSYLNIDNNELVEKFKKEHFPQVIKKIEIERPKFEYTFLFSNKVFSFSLILIIFISFYFLFIEVEKTPREYAIIPDLPENYISTIERANVDSLLNDKTNQINKDKNFAELENNPSSSSVIASSSKVYYDNSPLITLKFIDDTWLQLRDENDEIIISQLMNKNDEYSYNIDKNYSITSGNAGHIMVLINQKVMGKIGKKGQVVDSLVLDKNFNN